MRRSISIRTFFSLWFGFLIIVLSGILIIIIGNKSVEEVKYKIGDSLEETAYQMADKMDAFMWSRSGEIYTLSELSVLKDSRGMDEIQTLLDSLKENFPAFAWIGMTNEKGTVLASTQGILKGVDISSRPVFMEGSKGKFIGDVHDAVMLAKLLPNPTGEAMKFVDISVPVYDHGGSFKGVLAAHLSWEWAEEMKKSILEPLDKRKSIEMYVVSSKDNVVILGNKDSIGKQLGLPSLKFTGQKESNWFVETWEDGDTYLTGYALEKGYMNYEGLGWKIVVRQPLSHAYIAVRQLQLFILMTGMGGAFLFSLLSWFIAGKITSPIQKISSAAEALRTGKSTPIPQFAGIKEIEMLSVSLRELVNSQLISEKALGKLEFVAHNDHLTGIPNRTGLEKYMESVGNQALDGRRLVILCLDLDGFKNVNDTYGHHTGDILLKEVSGRLQEFAAKFGIAARLGGDEFVVILNYPIQTASEEGLATADSIIKALNAPFNLEGNTVHIGCSIGASLWDGASPLAEALKNADEALYTSKKSGKNRSTLYIKNS